MVRRKILLGSLTKTCKIRNDVVTLRLPIHCKLLEILIFEVCRIFAEQPYLAIMYQTLFLLGYYGLLRVGEISRSQHVLKAKDVHLALNKQKLLLILYSSKTHGKESLPQKIKIIGNEQDKCSKVILKRNFCPFKSTGAYLQARGTMFNDENEQFFIFRDRTAIAPHHVRAVLRSAILRVNLNPRHYGVHSFRIGRTCDLLKYGYTVEQTKQMGRWKSNAVYKYIRN